MTADYEQAIIRHRIDLGYLDGTLVGLIETIAGPDHLLIENVTVAPAFQGRGIGRALIAHAEGLAGSGGRAEVRLCTNKRFADNVRLYLYFGYRIDREEKLTAGVAVHMRKRLGAPVERAAQAG